VAVTSHHGPLAVKRALPVILVLPLLLTWPLARVFATRIVSEPSEEAAAHIWGLWAALEHRSPFVIETELLSFPDGGSLVLIDPANLVWYGLAGWLGPAAGFHAVVYGGVMLLGVAGALLARAVGGAPWLGAVVAMASPLTLSAALSGMTEMFGGGWVGIQLALLLFFLRRPDPRLGVGVVLTLALAWLSGPYNGIWASIMDVFVVLGLARRRDWRGVGRAAGVGVSAALLVAPWAWALLHGRPDDMPGSGHRAGLPAVVHLENGFRGGLQAGTDLLDPWLPIQLTGGEAEISRTAYIGVVALVAAVLAVRRERRLWPWLLGAAGFSVLSLGTHVYVAGDPLHVAGRPLLAPAGVLVVMLPVFGRLVHWYRAGVGATLLLAPLVSRSRRGWLVAPLVVLDALFLAPLQWPLPDAPLPDMTPYALLEGEGALLELPAVMPRSPNRNSWREGTVLAQTGHGRPIAGTMMNLPMSRKAKRARMAARRLMNRGHLSVREYDFLLRLGFRWLVIHPQYKQVTAQQRGNLVACLGEPLADTEEVWIFDLEAGSEGDCIREPR